MSLARVLVHHLAGIAKKAGYNFDHDCHAELDEECNELDERIAALEARAAVLERELGALRELTRHAGACADVRVLDELGEGAS